MINIYPKKIRERFGELIKFSHMNKKPQTFMAKVFLNTLLLSIIISAAAFFLINLEWWISLIILIGVFFVLQLFVYYSLVLKVDKETRKIEREFPDVLQLIASNLHAGLTLENSIFETAKKNKGFLKKRLEEMGRKLATGASFSFELKKFAQDFDSDIIKKVSKTIINASISGGSIAPLLQQIAINMREQYSVEDKLKASVGMYAIFIFFTIGIAAPILFSLSTILVKIIGGTVSQIDLPQTVSVPFTITQAGVSVNFVVWFCLIFIFFTSLIGSMIIGLIRKNSEKRGLQYFPILLTLSLILFFSIRLLLEHLFALFFNI